MTFKTTESDDLADWLEPRLRPGFAVEDDDGTERAITNVEMAAMTRRSSLNREKFVCSECNRIHWCNFSSGCRVCGGALENG